MTTKIKMDSWFVKACNSVFPKVSEKDMCRLYTIHTRIQKLQDQKLYAEQLMQDTTFIIDAIFDEQNKMEKMGREIKKSLSKKK